MKNALAAAIPLLIVSASVPAYAQAEASFNVACPPTSFAHFSDELVDVTGAWAMDFRFFGSFLPVLQPLSVESNGTDQTLTCGLDANEMSVTSTVTVEASSCVIDGVDVASSVFVCSR